MKKFIWGLTSASFLLISSIVYAHGPEEGYPMGPWMWWGHGVGWWIFPFVMMVVMILICYLLFWRRGGKSSWFSVGEQKDLDTPLEILKKRYAKGEISKEEFETIKKDL